jgi:hypothetical protein
MKKLILCILIIVLITQIDLFAKSDSVRINIRTIVGVGIVMNTTTPMFDIGLQYNKYVFDNNHKMIKLKLFQLSATPYCFFERDINNNIVVNDNWFVNAEWGIVYDQDFLKTWKGKEGSLGIGYLVAEKGGYFRNSTYKLFTSILLTNKVAIVPEFILTNNLTKILPGISLKIF